MKIEVDQSGKIEETSNCQPEFISGSRKVQNDTVELAIKISL